MRMNGRNRKSSPHVGLGRRENPNGQLRSTPHPTQPRVSARVASGPLPPARSPGRDQSGLSRQTGLGLCLCHRLG